MAETIPRDYQTSHPWITFTFDLRRLSHRAWRLLGEAESKCEHIAGVPLRPEVATHLHFVYLSKGVHGTTSIEGNTLSEEEVRARVDGDLELPPSQEYLGREVDNIVAACNEILDSVANGTPLELSRRRIESFNQLVLHGLEVEDWVVPGKIRTRSVGVLRYRGAPAVDCEMLVDRMCAWLTSPAFDIRDDREMVFTAAVVKAILAHLYIAWIHPFGDGNGRTARLLEYQLLVQAGIPSPAAHLLSNHYNMTRERYYTTLDRTSRPPYDPAVFVEYALEGFVDGLREQLARIREQQLEVTWENYVQERFRNQETRARIRQKHLVLDLPQNGTPVPRTRIRELTPRLAAEYANKGPKTLTRDLNVLQEMALIQRVRGGIVANRELMQAFLPLKARGTPDDAP